MGVTDFLRSVDDMPGILEVYLRLVIGKNIRHNSGNCHIVGIDQIMNSPIELPSSIAAHFAFCFTSCAVMLAFGHFQRLPILLSVLLLVTGSGIGTQGEVG